MAWTSDDQQVHKQLVVGGKLPHLLANLTTKRF